MKTWIIIMAIIIGGCTRIAPGGKDQIVKIIDFELSPDEDKIAFAAITPIGNSDIWVVDIDGTNLKKLTFKDRSPSNHVARFFKKRKWRNFYEVDIHSPLWTSDGRIAFAEETTRHHATGINIAGLTQRTIKPDGSDKRKKTDKDEIVRREPLSPIRSFEISDYSEKHRKKFFLKDDILWVLDLNETTPKKLVQN
ncbi:TolB family protein [Candidatus Omnitrophota bacterium]